MSNTSTITGNLNEKKESHSSIISWINSIIDREQKNEIGITVMYVMVGSGIASLTAALSLTDGISIPILIISSCLAMGTNASILSQQKFRISSWFFIISVLINTVLLVAQIVYFL